MITTMTVVKMKVRIWQQQWRRWSWYQWQWRKSPSQCRRPRQGWLGGVGPRQPPRARIQNHGIGWKVVLCNEWCECRFWVTKGNKLQWCGVSKLVKRGKRREKMVNLLLSCGMSGQCSLVAERLGSLRAKIIYGQKVNKIFIKSSYCSLYCQET